MPMYVIEREVPGAHELTAEQLQEASRQSIAVRNELGPADLQWVQSYIAEDKIFCVYIAKDTDIIQEHSRCLDIPASRICRVRIVTDPTTGGA